MCNCLGGGRVVLFVFYFILVERFWSFVVVLMVVLVLLFVIGLEKVLVYLKKFCEDVDNNGKYLWRD